MNDRKRNLLDHGEPELHSVGLKATAPRMRVLDVIRHSASRNLSAEEVYKQLSEQGPDVGLATVYRVLAQL